MEPFEIRIPATGSLSKLVLSVPTAADADRIMQICQDLEIQRWTTVPSPYTRQSALGFLTDDADG